MERKAFLIFVSYYCNSHEIVCIINSLRKNIKLNGFIIVSNNHEVIFPSGINVIYGSNRLLDMSGYFEGFDYADKNNQIKVNDVIIFANDSIYRKHSVLALSASIDQLLNKSKVPINFYAGVDGKILDPSGADFKYFSTYFFVVDYSTAKNFISKVGSYFFSRRRKILRIIDSLPLDKWSPAMLDQTQKNIKKLKRKCVALEFIFSSYAHDHKIFYPLPYLFLIKSLRFFIKARNFMLNMFKLYFR